MQTNDVQASSAGWQPVPYATMIKWWWAAIVFAAVVFAVTLTGLVSGRGLGAFPPVGCAFVAAMMSVGGMVACIWRGFLEAEVRPSPKVVHTR